jgi:hypothetical protein
MKLTGQITQNFDINMSTAAAFSDIEKDFGKT